MIKKAFEWSLNNPEIMIIAAVVVLILTFLYEAYENDTSICKAFLKSFLLFATGVTIAILFAL